MTPIESVTGKREGPLPDEVPTDADHLVNPRDHRAEALAAQQGHPKPEPPKSPELAEVLLWKARARQNKAEARAAEAERDLWQQQARKWEARAKANRRNTREAR